MPGHEASKGKERGHAKFGLWGEQLYGLSGYILIHYKYKEQEIHSAILIFECPS